MANVIKTNWKGKGASVPLAKAVGTVADTLRNVRMSDGQRVQRRAGRLIIPASAGRFPWHKLEFGYSVSGNVVTIFPGQIEWGEQSLITEETDVTIALDYSYVGIEAYFDGGQLTAAIIGPSTARTDFYPTSTKYRRALYQFRLVSGAVTLAKVCRTIKIGSEFGP